MAKQKSLASPPPDSSFPYYELSGTPEQIGKAAATCFGDRIRANYQFYEKLFAEILKIDCSDNQSYQQFRRDLIILANQFERNVADCFPDLDREIQAMASEAQLERWQLYVLNARTEIYRILALRKPADCSGECTALYFPESKLLGQNWDWHPRLEELCVITKIINQSGKSFVMLTEPGIIGKIGVNSDGLGVCLNILFSESEIKGIPIHIILRAVLESSNVAEATALLNKLPLGTTSNLLMADSSGAAINLEIKGDKIANVKLQDGALIHTNHFLDDEKSASESLPGSISRLSRAKILYQQFSNRSLEGMQTILTDRGDLDFPICRNYSKGLDFMVGTVASLIIDLEKKQLRVCKGQPYENCHWAVYQL